MCVRVSKFWLTLFVVSLFCQVWANSIPRPALVGYWENWKSLKLTEVHDNYNIIQLAFATTVGSSTYNMTFDIGPYSSDAALEADIDSLHSQGKKVVLSIGGANDPIFLNNETEKNQFVSTMKAILDRFNMKIDGIDIDIESTSFNFADWTVNSPAPGQTRLIEAVEEIMEYYSTQTGRHFLLTMAPETVYIVGGLSDYQASNLNGGAMIPIMVALMDSLDLLHPQFYNANESNYIGGGPVKNDGRGDYITAIADAILQGFELKQGLGTYEGMPASKFAVGLPASACDPYSDGWAEPETVVNALRYLKGEISKPNGFYYNLIGTYPEIAGMMTWSMNEDEANSSCTDSSTGQTRESWEFATSFKLAFPETSSSLLINSQSKTPKITLVDKHLYVDADLQGVSLELVDSQGRVIREIQVGISGVSLSSVEAGVYYLRSGLGQSIARVLIRN